MQKEGGLTAALFYFLSIHEDIPEGNCRGIDRSYEDANGFFVRAPIAVK